MSGETWFADVISEMEEEEEEEEEFRRKNSMEASMRSETDFNAHKEVEVEEEVEEEVLESQNMPGCL